MIRIIAFVCCVVGGFAFGLHLKKRAVQKNNLYADLVRYCVALQLNVCGKQLELGTFNADFCQSCSAPFCEALQQKTYCYCSALQKKGLSDFFANLDCVGGGALLEHLKFFQKQFETDLSEASASAKKASIYVKLGLLLGVMAGILFL